MINHPNDLMSLIILRHQTIKLKDKVRAENHWTIMNWSDLHLWEPEKVLWDLRPLDSLFSRIGQLVRLLSSRWSAQHQRLIIWAAPPQSWLAGSQMNHDGIALKETNNPSCGKCLNRSKMIISLSSGLPAALIQFQGADYLCRSWPKGNPIPGILLLNIYADLENSVNDYAQIGFRNWQYMQRMK